MDKGGRVTADEFVFEGDGTQTVETKLGESTTK